MILSFLSVVFFHISGIFENYKSGKESSSGSYNRLIRHPKIVSLETPRFPSEAQIFSLETSRIALGTSRIALEISSFSSMTPNISLETQTFHWRPKLFIEDPNFSLETLTFHWRNKLFVGDPNFSLESPDFRRRLPNCHCRPLKLKIRTFLQHATGWSCLDVVINLTVLHSLSLSVSLYLFNV